MKPYVLIGDLFQSDMQTLVNTVNCVGVMGKGIAEKFKKKFPKMYAQYRKDCKSGNISIGNPKPYDIEKGKLIINFPTKKHWRSPSLFSDIEKGLDNFVANYKDWGVKSVAFPPLGCGNGGLRWEDVGPLMYQKLVKIDVPVEIYAPYGTNSKFINKTFLEAKNTVKQSKGSKYSNATTPSNLAALEVLARLENNKYAKPIGRTMFQKIYFVLADLNVNTDLDFKKSNYGPFSKKVKNITHAFANQNLLKEEPHNTMMRQRVGEDYIVNRYKYATELAKYENEIEKTVDLFSRIKNTDQAEEVTTILYAVRTIAKENVPTEEEVLNYITDWKKHWNNNESKHSLVETIRSLEYLGWIKLNEKSRVMF